MAHNRLAFAAGSFILCDPSDKAKIVSAVNMLLQAKR